MLRKAILVGAALVLSASAALAEEPGYRLGKGDKVQIYTFGHEELTGEFEVDASGFIKFPLVGPIQAVGATLTELEEGLKGPLGERYVVNPRISANILEYSPIYVLGDVAVPGMFPFEPGLTVLHALALAGGFSIAEPVDIAIELIRAQEALRVIYNQIRAVQAQRARLVAERDGRVEIAFPAELLRDMSDPFIGDLFDSEVRSFQTRREGLFGEVDQLDRQKQFFREEIKALQAQLAAKSKQADLVKEELKDLEELSEKGLARRPQLLSVQGTLAGLEADATELIAFTARANQQIARTDQLILNRKNGYREEVLAELRDAQVIQEELGIRLSAAREALEQIRLRAAQGGTEVHPQERAEFIIVRNRGPKPQEIRADEGTAVLPGDVIRVPFAAVGRQPAPQGAHRGGADDTRASSAVAFDRRSGATGEVR